VDDSPAFTPGKVIALGEETKAASGEVLVMLVNAKFGSFPIGIESWTSRSFVRLHTYHVAPFAWFCKSSGGSLLANKYV
jgi:hypothetical protein